MANDMREAFKNVGISAPAKSVAPQTRANSGYSQQTRANSGYNQQQRQTAPRISINLKNFDVVAEAEKAMRSLQYLDKKGNPKIDVTTSQIRKFLTAVNVVRNRVDLFKAKNIGVSKLSDELVAEVKFLKVNLLYQAGRERTVKTFMEKTRLDSIIDSIGAESENFVKFTKYVEALVAYHKFLGGRDK